MSVLRTVLFLAAIGYCSSQNCSYSALLHHLNLTTTNDLLANVRPVKTWTTPSHVVINMLLYGILEVNLKSQTFLGHIWTDMRWKNEFLLWNASDFCGIDKLWIPRKMLWTPDVVIEEDASDSSSIAESPYVTVHPDGLVIAYKQQRLTSTCQFSLYLFPFDKQKCSITFTSMSFSIDTVTLGTATNESLLTSLSNYYMVTEGEWKLHKLHIVSENTSERSKLIYTVTLERKPMLYVIIFIAPLFYMLILDLASYFINEARGEKLSFKVTILLSIAVLLLILKDMLPSTEDTLPWIAVYCVVIFALVGISLLEVMLVSFLFDFDSKTPQSLINKEKDEPEFDQQKEHVELAAKGELNPENCCLPLDWADVRVLLKLILEEVKAARQEGCSPRQEDTEKPGCNKRLAKIIDCVFFVAYFLTVLLFLACMYFVWIHDYVMNNS